MDAIDDIFLEVLCAIHAPKLAEDLATLSAILYKQNNVHGRFKFYQNLKQIERNMKRFSSLKIKEKMKKRLK